MASGEDLLVGLIALALVPLIAWRVRRGLKDGRLPLYRTYVGRDEAGTKFALLLALHALSFVLVAVIAADLLFQLGLKEAL
jgi:hypothetical protein